MILSAIGSHRPLSGKTNSIYSGSLLKAKTDQCHTSPLELGKHELIERPCSYDFAIMKRLNFMSPPDEFALTVIATPVPRSVRMVSRKDAKNAKTQRRVKDTDAPEESSPPLRLCGPLRLCVNYFLCLSVRHRGCKRASQ